MIRVQKRRRVASFFWWTFEVRVKIKRNRCAAPPFRTTSRSRIYVQEIHIPRRMTKFTVSDTLMSVCFLSYRRVISISRHLFSCAMRGGRIRDLSRCSVHYWPISIMMNAMSLGQATPAFASFSSAHHAAAWTLVVNAFPPASNTAGWHHCIVRLVRFSIQMAFRIVTSKVRWNSPRAWRTWTFNDNLPGVNNSGTSMLKMSDGRGTMVECGDSTDQNAIYEPVNGMNFSAGTPGRRLRRKISRTSFDNSPFVFAFLNMGSEQDLF